MKWVQVNPSKFKFVHDDDPRPSVELESRKGAPNLHFTPSWKRYEQNVWTPDGVTDNTRMDKFLAERDHETKTDLKAKRWEEGRKREWAKNKPAWRKEMMQKGVI